MHWLRISILTRSWVLCVHLGLNLVSIPPHPPTMWLPRCLSPRTLPRPMSVVSVTYKLIFGNVTIYFIGLFSPTNVLIPQCEKILKQIPRKRGFFFLVSGEIWVFYFAQPEPFSRIHIHIYEHFPEKLICNTFLKYQHNGIYLQKNISLFNFEPFGCDDKFFFFLLSHRNANSYKLSRHF